MTPPARSAELVLVTPDGRVVGRWPPIPVATPWWQDIEPVVQAASERYGTDVTVLRLLEAEYDQPPGGRVRYLAEVTAPIAADPWPAALDDHPLRLSYARPGGPAADLAWAKSVLEASGRLCTAPPTQVRTWNLSSLWRIPTDRGMTWLKAVPPFFAHEGALLEALAGEAVPVVLGRQSGRLLMPEIPGADLYTASPEQLPVMIDRLVALQSSWSGRAPALLELGLPDWRATALSLAIAAIVQRCRAQLSEAHRSVLDAFVEGLPRRFADLASCGLSDTLVHGDFHPGNFRGGPGLPLILLDWGDSGVGHPLLDQPAFLSRIPGEQAGPSAEHWIRRWREAVPGGDPARAAHLLAPIAAARQAVIYQGFLDRIEPSEHPYHRADPQNWLQRTAEILLRTA
jgi:Ser/Thr protein kinase RdoA (MazF antagonist)